MRPFQRGRFDELPEHPHRPHADASTHKRVVRVESAPFGTVQTFVRELGSGPPLLLVHGLMTTGYSWRYVVAELAESHRVIVPDLPGAGRTHTRAGLRYDADALATWIGELVDTMKIHGCRAVGNSLGGYLCMRAVQRDATVFQRLVNIHSPAMPEPRYHALGAGLRTLGVAGALSRVIAIDPMRWVHRNVHYWDESLKSIEEAREYAYPLRTPEGRANFISYLRDAVSARGIEAFNRTLERERFPIPLMLLYARQDPMVAPKHGEHLRRLVPDADFRWIENTSHFMHVDTPEPVLDALREFLVVQSRP